MKYFLLSLFAITIFSSCEKVIDIDLNSSDPKLVIECLITDSAGPYHVRLTRTVDYFDGGTIPTVTNAQVTIRDNSGNNEQLTQTQPGVYSTSTIAGIPGRTYYLSVTVDGKTYSAESTMALPVSIDSAYADLSPPLFGSDTGYTPIGAFSDPAGQTNFYRQRISINGELQDIDGTYFLLDDILNDGRDIRFPLFPFPAQSGDQVTIELWTLNEPAYNYYLTLSNISGGGGPESASPGNPNTMISGGALGYFIACPIRNKTFTVQ
jgi:hypothetical protein